ncbi:MAG TPA: DUF2975 domain-containing protein [Segetibacter sp.]
MKTVRYISNLLFYFCRITVLFQVLTGVYGSFVLILQETGSISSLPISNIGDDRYVIFFPFTRQPFLTGVYDPWSNIIAMLTFLLYGLFFWLLSDIFKTFRQPKLFTPSGVNRLKRFYVGNLTIPILMLLVLAVSGDEVANLVSVTFLHMILGVFAFFMAAIFQQGLLLQEEQDLTL